MIDREIPQVSKGSSWDVSGIAYWPLTVILRSADLPLTMPLTQPCQEARRAKISARQVFPIAHGKMPVFRLLLPAESWIQA
jgi:hypothetical protein